MTAPNIPAESAIQSTTKIIHDTILVHDTIPKVVKETLYVLKESTIPWDRWAAVGVTSIAAMVAAAIAVKGWKKNQELARENQLKAFEEGVLDKIRIDLIPLFSEHREWVLQFRKLVIALSKNNADYEWNSLKGNPLVDEGQPAAKFFRRPLDFAEINEFLKENNRKWILRMFDYQDLFKPMVNTLEIIGSAHHSIVYEIREFIKKYNPLIPDYIQSANVLFRTNTKLDELDSLRDQFFRYFQYECLKSIPGVTLPEIKVMSYHDQIIRAGNGAYRIADAPEKIVRAKIAPANPPVAEGPAL